MSELAQKLIAENKRTKNPRLDLGNCGLREFPMEVLELGHLEWLNLRSSWWDYEKSGETRSANSGERNTLAFIPDLGALTQLQVVLIGGGEYFSKWPLEKLDFVKKLNYPVEMNVSYCAISDLGPLTGLKSITKLDFRINKVSDLVPLTGLK
jgi:internalin A